MRLLIILLIITCQSNCSVSQKKKFDDPNFMYLISNDTLPLVNSETNITDVVNDACNIECKDNGGYSGQFSMKYSLRNKSFIDFTNDDFVINLPFIGYKCPNSLTDHFYSTIKFKLNENSDSIPILVKKHIIKTRSEYNYPPLIEILADKERKTNDLSELIYCILLGYIELCEQISLVKWNKRIVDLDKEKIKIIAMEEPLRLRITSESGNIYCPKK